MFCKCSTILTQELGTYFIRAIKLPFSALFLLIDHLGCREVVQSRKRARNRKIILVGDAELENQGVVPAAQHPPTRKSSIQ